MTLYDWNAIKSHAAPETKENTLQNTAGDI